MQVCGFLCAWGIGCGEPVTSEVRYLWGISPEFCVVHRGVTCRSCGSQATHTCYETGRGLICAEPLCDVCEHTIARDGTNGGVSPFRLETFPEGLGPHCRKDQQVYTPWTIKEGELVVERRNGSLKIGASDVCEGTT